GWGGGGGDWGGGGGGGGGGRGGARVFGPAVCAGNSWIKQEAASLAKPTQTQWEREPMSMPAACGCCTGRASTWAASRCRRASLLTLARVLRRLYGRRGGRARGGPRPGGGGGGGGWVVVGVRAVGTRERR